MENKLELHLDKCFKEYLDVKNYLKNFYLKLPKLKGELAKKLSGKDEEQVNEISYKDVFWVSALEGDLAQLTGRLYHTFQAYKQLENSAEKIEIEKELKEIKFNLTYSVKGDQVDVVDKEGYDFYKNQFLETQKYLKLKVGEK
jgi:hypothetical protein